MAGQALLERLLARGDILGLGCRPDSKRGDNGECGGVNVTFDGVYRKKRR